MPRILHLKAYPFSIKISISFFILALLLITILFAIIVPKMQKEQYNTKIKEIEQVLSITEEQIKLAGKAIVMQTQLEIKLNKKRLELTLVNLQENLNTTVSIEDIKKKLNNTIIPEFTNYAITYNGQIFINKNKKIFNKHKIQKFNTWEVFNTKKVEKDYVYTQKYYFFSKKFSKDLEITIFARDKNLNPNHFPYEKTLKINMQNTFNITQNLHKEKTYMFWLNSKYKDEDDKPLYIKDIIKSEEKYTLSKMSNVTNIYTGDLSAKDIVEGKNKKFIEHTLNDKDAISWIRDVYKEEFDGYMFLLVNTVYKEDIIKHTDSALLKVLPAAFISLLLAIIIGFFLFRNLFTRINTLATTAQKVINGNKHTRSEVKGDDVVGILGIAFDSMLSSLQDNIKTLDIKVEEKTKKLQNSLEEKEILLKEVHHRVKNNLALTISLIKLQQEEITEKKIKKTLNDIQERIYTMELLHRKLYESTNLNKINFHEYVLNLVHNISMTYLDNKNIKININIDEIYLNIEKAMPCGLILNEIITNAFKYAFKNNPKPKLTIQMKEKNDKYILSIKDNGEGIKDSINIYESNTLGLKLINTISTLQLKGALKYSYKNGALFKITF